MTLLKSFKPNYINVKNDNWVLNKEINNTNNTWLKYWNPKTCSLHCWKQDGKERWLLL